MSWKKKWLESHCAAGYCNSGETEKISELFTLEMTSIFHRVAVFLSGGDTCWQTRFWCCLAINTPNGRMSSADEETIPFSMWTVMSCPKHVCVCRLLHCIGRYGFGTFQQFWRVAGGGLCTLRQYSCTIVF